MLQLARRQSGGNSNPLTLNEMAREEGLTISHVAKLIRRLRRAGLVRSVLGRTGGYSLARSAEVISIAEVMSALGGKLYDHDYCKKFSGDLAVCSHMGDCSIRSLWGVLETLLERVLGQTMLSELIRSEQGMTDVLGSRVPAETPRASRGCS
jgi:Rrf2 family protein